MAAVIRIKLADLLVVLASDLSQEPRARRNAPLRSSSSSASGQG